VFTWLGEAELLPHCHALWTSRRRGKSRLAPLPLQPEAAEAEQNVEATQGLAGRLEHVKVSQHGAAYLKITACGGNDTMHYEAAGQARTEGGWSV
jgi:hypothetical protein